MHFPVPAYKEGKLALSPDMVALILRAILDSDAQPVYIHCLSGIEVVGAVIICLRKLENLPQGFALSEFLRFSAGKSVEPEFADLFKAFDPSVVAAPAKCQADDAQG
ncbi:hypothetical protein H696_04917 [Fonticula alba]|uniref:Tyrosine specific protein phosphatases domain-containing protein n=1 Tax=Fonticula alba TaxID=691883 RepID=A0A058Z3B9_FONAL|nr:hypothetical protein H696_04917 [Fonticula alba]KCV68626.1 hypothetical protein H696_04917 [Fonticula alba]|eukprot:XP_009497058.1 hypothetical protein H696_04917 [Fonticula alba]